MAERQDNIVHVTPLFPIAAIIVVVRNAFDTHATCK